MNPQATNIAPSNIELLRSHLSSDSLASKLVLAFEQTTAEEVALCLDDVLNQRVEEVRRVIADGKTELG